LLFKGYGAKVGLGNMRVKAENRMVTFHTCLYWFDIMLSNANKKYADIFLKRR